MNKAEIFSPIELQSIVNAALFEARRHPESYKIATCAAKRLNKWLVSTIWDNPDEPSIKIEEAPF